MNFDLFWLCGLIIWLSAVHTLRAICGVVYATIRATRWAIRDAVSQHNRLRALQKKQWLLGLKWQKGLNKRIHPVNAPELVRDLNLCER